MTSIEESFAPYEKAQLHWALLPKGTIKKAKSRFDEKKVKDGKTIQEQIYLMQGESMKTTKKTKLYFTHYECGVLFRIDEVKSRRYYISGQKRICKGEDFTTARPKKLTKAQSDIVVAHILKCESINEPLDATELTNYVNDLFNIEISST